MIQFASGNETIFIAADERRTGFIVDTADALQIFVAKFGVIFLGGFFVLSGFGHGLIGFFRDFESIDDSKPIFGKRESRNEKIYDAA